MRPVPGGWQVLATALALGVLAFSARLCPEQPGVVTRKCLPASAIEQFYRKTNTPGRRRESGKKRKRKRLKPT